MSVVYREYIASDTWKQRRVDALERSGRKNPVGFIRSPRCEFCGQYGTSHKNSRSQLDSKDRRFRVDQSNGLEVHHVTYRRLGEESPNDLIVLCTDVCYYDAYHSRMHAWSDRTRKLVGESNEDWRQKRLQAGPSPELPTRVGCHERAHDDPEFRSLIEELARGRTYR